MSGTYYGVTNGIFADICMKVKRSRSSQRADERRPTLSRGSDFLQDRVDFPSQILNKANKEQCSRPNISLSLIKNYLKRNIHSQPFQRVTWCASSSEKGAWEGKKWARRLAITLTETLMQFLLVIYDISNAIHDTAVMTYNTSVRDIPRC
jgi:hypothetical protein